MPTSAARPKRAAEEYARAQEASSKKPRFDARNPSTLAADAPEDDLILNADVIGKSGTQTKRNAVNIDGYESDSDNDNFNERAELRDKAQRHRENGAAGVSKDEDDDDMFAEAEEAVQGTADGDDDEELTREGKRKSKDVRFLDEADIEGQVTDSKSGGHVSAQLLLGRDGKKRASSVTSSSSSGDEDEDRDMLPDEEDEDAAELGAGSKKKHAPRLNAFNLREELEDGKFDEAGNFVRKAADPEAVNDRWLEGLSKKDMKKAREAQEKRDEDRRRKNVEDDAVLTSDLLSTLVRYLDIGETPLEALQRLNKGRQKEAKIPKWKRKRQGEMDVDGDANEDRDPAETARKQAVEAITSAADALYSRGQSDIYDEERELLLRQFKRETGDEWRPLAAGDAAESWEYRWSDARDGVAHHGPFDAATMKAWSQAGYFGEGVEFRRTGEADWSSLLDVQ